MSATNTETNPLENVDWEDVLDTLEEQKCVLFLGSGAFSAPGGGDINTALHHYLDADNPEHKYINVSNPDGFFLFKKSRYKRRVIGEMRDFFNQPFPETEAQFGRLARLPFPMIVTLTPDNILSRVFDAMGFESQLDFYHLRKKAGDEFKKPTGEKPLIYNLLGNVEEPESMVLTHSDFFDYLQSVFVEGNRMHVALREELEAMDRYIFLGLPYEKWYFQLLLRVLSLHSEKLSEIERMALKEFEDPRLHKIYTDEFKLEFFPANTEEFIGELYRRCEAANLLKTVPEVDPSFANLPDPTQEQLLEWVAKAETEKAMIHLKVFLDRRKPKSSELVNELTVLRNQYNLLQQRQLRGTIDSRDFPVENQQIIERLLNLIAKSFNL